MVSDGALVLLRMRRFSYLATAYRAVRSRAISEAYSTCSHATAQPLTPTQQ